MHHPRTCWLARAQEEILQGLLQGRGAKYEPQVVDVCVALFREQEYK